jgi:hypothetical protein
MTFFHSSTFCLLYDWTIVLDHGGLDPDPVDTGLRILIQEG